MDRDIIPQARDGFKINLDRLFLFFKKPLMWLFFSVSGMYISYRVQVPNTLYSGEY